MKQPRWTKEDVHCGLPKIKLKVDSRMGPVLIFESMKKRIENLIYPMFILFVGFLICLIIIGFGLLIKWCQENPPCGIVVGVAFLGTMMVGLPVYWFIKALLHTLKKGIVVGYFLSFFAWIIAIIVGIVGDLFAILGVCVFLGTGIIALIYHVIMGRMKKREEKRMEALALELEDQLTELKEQLGRGVITQEEYEQQKKKLLEKSEA